MIQTFPQNTKRENYLDVGKGIAIFFVVIGHARGLPLLELKLIFSFHVPYFFFLSGWTVGLSPSKKNPIQFVTKQFSRLIIPYIFFFLLGYVYWLLTRHIGVKQLQWGMYTWWDPLRGLFTGMGDLLYVSPGLWFLPCLFLTKTFFCLLSVFATKEILFILLSIIAYVLLSLCSEKMSLLPFSASLMPVTLFFYSLGQLMSKYNHWLFRKKWIPVAILFVSVVPWFFLSIRNAQLDLNLLKFGNSTNQFFPETILGISIFTSLSIILRNNRFLSRMGKKTLSILGSHLLVFSLFSGIFSALGLKQNMITAFATTLVALGIASVLQYIFEKKLPWVVGLKTATAS